MAAATAVFDTAELLEAILLQLPLADILRAQRIDRTFHDAIKKSPSVQRALFQKPCGDFTVELIDCDRFLMKECLSLETCNDRDMAPIRKTGSFYSHTWVQSGTDRACSIVINPLLLTYQDIRIIPGHYTYNLDAASSWSPAAKASWEKMFLTQPPVGCVVVDTGHFSGHYHILRSQDKASGITFGDLQRFAETFRTGPDLEVAIIGIDIWSAKNEARILPVTATAADILAEIEMVKGEKKEEIEEPESD
ncbi:hypothetical protein CB0940_10286 [Cercospora beticola]|uniref:F-box domain-containing protein n=1 Tax=Cercospora beticola TaxID=122368 RepID=A0A2G5HTI4_CERBT|nr:hypothetical protein CB0940_10286 [Cercospora beticola]PIA95836.1 hypothetical protein CB0940_10286 [Cercospora beticola]WPB06992.1 hypothetical protein RHO25_011652 [Cercospora beticola]CAK1366925.1 unnamed protein product [Cercospora beticola]